MADDTPQKMIDAEKRKLQTQAFDDPFMAEMKAAEEKGDLPPARVRAIDTLARLSAAKLAVRPLSRHREPEQNARTSVSMSFSHGLTYI